MRVKKGSSYKYFEDRDGVKICYDAQILDADDYVLIMLHGLGGDLESWSKERELLSKLGVSTVAMDLRGHGYSSRSEDESFYDLNNYSNDVAKLIAIEKIKKPVFVGHCFGGMIALLTEATFPESAKAMILIDTGDKPPGMVGSLIHHGLARRLLHLISIHSPSGHIKGHIDSERFVNTADLDYKRIVSDIMHTSLKTYLFIVEKMIGYDVEKKLTRMVLPTLILEGVNDTVFPPIIAQHLKDKIRFSEIDFISNANHIILTNNPFEVTDEIYKFIKKLPRVGERWISKKYISGKVVVKPFPECLPKSEKNKPNEVAENKRLDVCVDKQKKRLVAKSFSNYCEKVKACCQSYHRDSLEEKENSNFHCSFPREIILSRGNVHSSCDNYPENWEDFISRPCRVDKAKAKSDGPCCHKTCNGSSNNPLNDRRDMRLGFLVHICSLLKI